MKPDQRIVTQLPLDELWDARGPVDARRTASACGRETIAEMLRIGPVSFVVADIGSALRWVVNEEAMPFWKGEVLAHLAEPGKRMFLDDFPNGYAYVASVWSTPRGDVVLLETHH